MRGHDRDDLDEDLNEYEEDRYYQEEQGDEYQGEGEEEEEEEEEEEPPKPTKEELEYLALRQELKEAVRRRMKKESATSLGHSQEKNKKLPYDNYGSFFGPSQPVIARRVLEESRSIMETQHIQAKNPSSHSVSKKSTASTTTETKSNEHYRPPKVVNEVKMKVQRLKDTRDYSFLLSDDAELPASSKEPASRNVSVLSSDARSAQVQSKNRPSSMNKPSSMSKPSSTSKPARPLSSGHEERKSVANGRDDRKSVSSGREDRKFVSGREDRNSVSMNRQVQTKVAHPKAAPVSRPERSSADPRKLLGSNQGNGPGRPTGSKGPLPKAPATALDKKKTSAVGTNSSVPGKQKTPQFKSHSSSQNQYAEQKRVPQRPEKSKMMSKQPVSSSKPQVKPPKQIPSRAIQEARPKKRPVHNYSDDDDEDAAAINMIRSMFRYNPNKYVDDDVSDMEANFDDILKEERRSSKIAREEDEREARLIEEEERRERLKKEAKRRKLSQSTLPTSKVEEEFRNKMREALKYS